MELVTVRGRVDLYENFNYSLNYTTADVTNLTKRKTSYTKTVTVPYTSENARIFVGLDQANSDNVGYDTREALPCFLQHNGRVLIEGILIVLDWSKLKEKQEIQLQIIQRTKAIVKDLKGVNLNTLDFSKLNHTYNLDNVLQSYDGFNVVNGTLQAYQGYVYPLIDYGKDDTVPNRWDLINLRPSLFLREIIDVLFLNAGRTYTSDFFNSEYWNNLILINTLDRILYTDAQRLPFETNLTYPNQWYTRGDADTVPLTPTNLPWWNSVLGYNRTIPLDTVITDVNAQWDLTNPLAPLMTIQRTGRYRFNLSMEFFMETYVNVPEYNSNFWYLFTLPHTEVQGEVTNSIEIVKNGIVYTYEDVKFTPVASTFYAHQFGEPWVAYPNPPQFLTWEIELDLNAGDTINFRQHMLPYNESGLARWLNCRFNTQYVEVKSELVEAIILPGDELNFSNYIPEIKADKFLNTILNTFNLWAIDDPYNPDNLIIEPRTNFFDLGGYVDWSEKYDASRLIKNNFLADKLPARFRYEFAKSDDVAVKNYFELNQKGYADYDSEVETNISIDEQTIKTDLTPLKCTEQNELLYPLLFKQEDNSTQKRGLGKTLKIGFVSEQIGVYQIDDGTVNTLTRYICASEFDDPRKPLYSLTFGEPDTDLLQSQGAYWNLYRLFHQLTEEEKTRKGAKVVSLFVYLNENDIALLDLRRVVYINGVYYRIVQIENFNPLTNAPTRVKLLQIEAVKYDFTSNEIIYKNSTDGGTTKVLATNTGDGELITTNNNRNVSTS